MICRVWHGWTTRKNADTYESMLKQEIFKGIQERNISGYQRIQLFRNEDQNEVEFITIMYFDSLDAIREFAGEDYEQSVVPEKARKVLSRFDERVRVYELRDDIGYIQD
jgi:heme-degrading monooxygenase HmoA